VIAALVLATAATVRAARLASRPRVPDEAVTASRRPAPRWLVEGLARADVDLDGRRVLDGWLAAAAVGTAMAVVLGGAALAVVVAAVSVSAVPIGLHLQRDRADRRLEAALPEALDAIARSLRSGASLRQAVRDGASGIGGVLGTDLRRVVAEIDDGVPLADALDGWRRRRPLPGVRLVTAALSLGATTGGASARAVDGLSQTLRTNAAITAEVRALSSQARLSALVIALAPIGFTVVAASADPRVARFLLRTPAGLLCLAVGLGLDAIGALWMRRLSLVRA